MRKGLSELVGSLLLIAIIGSLMTYMIISSNTISYRMLEVADDAAAKLDDAREAPYLSVYLTGSELHLKIYSFKPLKIKGVIYQKAENISYIVINKTIIDQYDLVVDKNYSCLPARIYVEAESGVIYSYNPGRDPRILSLPADIRGFLLSKTYIDCELLNNNFSRGDLNGSNSSQTITNITNIYTIYNDISYRYNVVEVTPSSALIYGGNPYTLKIVKINVTGSLALGGNLTYTVAFKVSGTERIFGPVEIGPLTKGVLLTKYVATLNDDNQTVDIIAAAYCTYLKTTCIAGILFKNSNNILVSGEGYVELNGNYRDSSTTCPFSKYVYVAPMLLAPLSNFTSEVNVTCSEIGGIGVSIHGETQGEFATHSGIIFAVAGTPASKIELNSIIYIREINLFSINSTQISIYPLNFITYKLLPEKIIYEDQLIKAVKNFLYYNYSDNITLYITFNNLTITRQATAESKDIPYENITLLITYTPKPVLPLRTITVTEYEYSQTGISYMYKYSWTISSGKTPAPYPQLLPKILLIYDNSSRIAYLIVFPVGSLSVSQFNQDYYGLARLLAGTSYSLSGTCSSYITFPVEEISMSQGITIQTSIYEENLATINFIQKPGDYLLICKSSVTCKEFYYSIYIKAY